MKKKIAILLTICMMASLCGCTVTGDKNDTSKTNATNYSKVDLNEVVASVEKKIKNNFKPQIGIVLGSGLNALANEVDVVQTIAYEDISGFPKSTVDGHNGRYILGYLEGVPVIMMDGRVHYYEGYSMEEVVTPVRVMAKLGADEIIISNASGSVRADYPVGSLVCIEDHIASFVPNVLIGQNDDSLGERFVGMDNAYDSSLRQMAHEAANELGMNLLDGVYLQVTGPSYETTAEAKMYASLGADVVGMSTACEVIALKQMNVKVRNTFTAVSSGVFGSLLRIGALTRKTHWATPLRKPQSTKVQAAPCQRPQTVMFTRMLK